MRPRSSRLLNHGKVRKFARLCFTASSASFSVDAEFVLHAQHVGAVGIQLIRRRQIGIQILLIDLEAHPQWVIISFRAVIHGHHNAFGVFFLRGHRLTEVVGEGCDAAATGHVVTEESDSP